jgi:hypothetical protein
MPTPLGDSLDFLQYEALNIRLQQLSSDPSAPVTGQAYWNAADSHFRLYNGASFAVVPFVGAVTPTALTVAGAAAPGTSLDAARVDHAHAMPGLATGAVSGFMYFADKAKLDAATPSPTANTLALRDAAGRMQAVDPASGQDVATLAYVTAVINARDPKASVMAKTTGNVNLANPGTAVFDTVTVPVGNRILAGSQTLPAENGIYIFNGASSAMTRAPDADTWAELQAAYVIVEQGAANPDTGWLCTIDAGGTLGTTAVTWAPFGNATNYSAANDPTITGIGVYNTVAGTQFRFRAIKAGSTKVSATLTGQDIVLDIVEANILLPNLGGVLPISKGGTGAITAVLARAALGAVGKAAATIGDGVTTSFLVNHALGTTDVTVDVWEATGLKRKVLTTTVATDANNVTVTFGRAPTAGQYRVVVTG